VVFSSLIFLYLFLPACMILYFAVKPIGAKNIILLIFSLLFYAWGEPIYIFLMLASSAFNYLMGLAMGKWPTKKKAALVWSVIVNLCALGVFKYAGLLVETWNQLTGILLPVPQIALPIGISFYTFQAMSYVVDVYRGHAQVQKSLPRFVLYVALFPQLIAGPIVRYSDIEQQLLHRESNWETIFYGLLRFCVGLGKKILIADYAGQIAGQMLDGQLAFSTTAGVWLGVIMFTFQIYFDFSGYSDMAIGLGYMFGFKYRENFDLPYTSASITEFWRRWHMSLGSFFRDYVYIPLGGNRRHRLLNLLITWGLTGLWHGASWNFLLWGLYFFVILAVEKQLWSLQKKTPKFLRQLLTLVLIVLGWTIFYFTDFQRLWTALQVMVGAAGSGLISGQVKIQLLNALPLLVVCVLGSTRIPRTIGEIFGLLCTDKEHHGKKQVIYVTVTFLFCLCLLVLSTISLVGSSFSAFLYYRF